MSVTITEKQKRYAHATIRNLKRKIPKGKAELLKEAGYTMKHPNAHIVEKSSNYQEYFRSQITEESLKDVHKKLLNAGTLRREFFSTKLEDSEIEEIVNESGLKFIKVIEEDVPFQGKRKVAYCKLPILDVIKGATDMAYKVLGNYAPEKKEIKTLNINGLLDKLEKGESLDEDDD